MTKDDNVENNNNGGPSSRIRKGQIDWIIGISKPSDFKSWLFKFKVGSRVYLSNEVYTDEQERHDAWMNALVIAATRGNFEEMLYYLELLENDGVRCETLLEHLERKFVPTAELARKQSIEAFMKYTRNRKTLMEAVKELRVIVLECNKHGYNPEKETLIAKYESLLQTQELPIFRSYEDRYKSLPFTTEFEKYLRALEELAKDQEEKKPNKETEVETFAGAAKQKFRKDTKRSGYRSKKNDEENATNKSKCTRCGYPCPATKGKGKDKCPAANKTCNKCGKKGHFAEVCRTKDVKEKAAENKHKAGAAVAQSDEECFC